MIKSNIVMLFLVCLMTGIMAQPYNLTETTDIVYGKGWVTSPSEGLKDLKMDAYIPDNPATDRTAIIYAHGGGWKEGDKASRVSDFRDLAKRGFCLFSINYRMVGDSLVCPKIADGTAPEFPAARAAVVDMKAAIRYVRAHAAEYGLAKDRIVVMGGSAGAYTAVVAAVTENDSLINDGPSDPAIPHNNPTEESKPNLCVEMYGFVITWLPNFRADIDSTDPPTMILHGQNDALIPFADAYTFRAYLRNEGVPWEMHIIDGGAHGEWFDSTNVWTEDFIQEHLYAASITDSGIMPTLNYSRFGAVRLYDLLGRAVRQEKGNGVYIKVTNSALVEKKLILR